MNLKVLKSMSLEEIAEFDRLMGNVAQAMDELEMFKKGELKPLGLTVGDFERILEAQKAAFLKFKTQIVEKYVVDKFHEFE